MKDHLPIMLQRTLIITQFQTRDQDQFQGINRILRLDLITTTMMKMKRVIDEQRLMSTFHPDKADITTDIHSYTVKS